MFDLSSRDLSGRILDCASGPASFNAEATQRSCNVVSCDPHYQSFVEEISGRIEETCETLLTGVTLSQARYVWNHISSPDELGRVCMAAMRRFLDDFARGLKAKHYLPDELPSLPYGNGEFGLALCPHFLFTYSDQLSASFHVAAIREVCRVAHEARIFPLLSYDGAPSPLLEHVVDELRALGYLVETRQVPYEFQKGGDRLLSAARVTL